MNSKLKSRTSAFHNFFIFHFKVLYSSLLYLRLSEFTVPEDAGIVFATLALAVKRILLDLIHTRLDLIVKIYMHLDKTRQDYFIPLELSTVVSKAN
jgi:hypothetical protein